jgi:hypothetical protein
MTLGILAVIVAGPLTGFLGWGLVGRRFPSCGQPAEGRAHRAGGGAAKWAGPPATTTGNRIRFTEALDMGVEFHKGQRVTVHYDPVNPRDSATIKDAYDVTTGLMVMSGVTLMFALAFIFGVYLVAKNLH